MKPILFNTEMVRVILDGRKTVTRRVVKPQPLLKLAYAGMGYKHGTWGYPNKDVWQCWGEEFRQPDDLPSEERQRCWKPPCHAGDILYVRETWCQYGKLDDCDRLIDGTEEYYFRADGENPTPFNDFLVQHSGWDEHRETPVWHPSIHMPKEAARIFLRVTEVRVERLQEITEDEAIREGCIEHGGNLAIDDFEVIWDSTIKKADLPLYGWDANPWVWRIEFERIERPEGE